MLSYEYKLQKTTLKMPLTLMKINKSLNKKMAETSRKLNKQQFYLKMN